MNTRWLLPLLLVANGALGLAIAERAATLRRSWQAWEVRTEAQARLKYLNSRGTPGAARRGAGHGDDVGDEGP